MFNVSEFAMGHNGEEVKRGYACQMTYGLPGEDSFSLMNNSFLGGLITSFKPDMCLCGDRLCMHTWFSLIPWFIMW